MKNVLAITALTLSLFATISSAQITSSRSSNETRSQDVVKAQETVNKVLLDAGNSFKEALLAYVEGNRSVAAEKFNKSVEVFLYSTLNIQREPKLQGCYNQLIETLYRIEFPSDNQLPQIRDLSVTCSWNNIDNALADKAAIIVKDSMPKSLGPLSKNTGKSKEPSIGFNTQEFEPSPLDELSKLELTPDKKEVPSTATLTRATSPCNLTLRNAPALRGVKLGMTPNEVSSVLGRTLKLTDKETRVENGKSKVQVNIGEKYSLYQASVDQKISRLDGILFMVLDFFNSSLYRISLSYAKSNIEWKDGREFSVILSEKLKMPKDAWVSYAEIASIRCSGFSIFASVVKDGSSFLMLTNEVAAKAVETKAKQVLINEERRRKDAELDKKRVFKP